MNLEKLFTENKMLNSKYNFNIKKKNILPLANAKLLAVAHLEKSDHNMEFLDFIKNEERFVDWYVVGLYYSLYHAALALVANKGFISKNHTATLIFLIKHYSTISKEDIKLIDDLSVNKNDAEL